MTKITTHKLQKGKKFLKFSVLVCVR